MHFLGRKRQILPQHNFSRRGPHLTGKLAVDFRTRPIRRARKTPGLIDSRVIRLAAENRRGRDPPRARSLPRRIGCKHRPGAVVIFERQFSPKGIVGIIGNNLLDGAAFCAQNGIRYALLVFERQSVVVAVLHHTVTPPAGSDR